MRSLVSCW